MHQVSRTVDSITLSWSQPDQPNGVILDYELQYYEKVPVLLGALPTPASRRAPFQAGAGVLPSRKTRQSGEAERALASAPLLPSCETSGSCLDLSESCFSGLGGQATISVKRSGHSPFPTKTPFILTLMGLMF